MTRGHGRPGPFSERGIHPYHQSKMHNSVVADDPAISPPSCGQWSWTFLFGWGRGGRVVAGREPLAPKTVSLNAGDEKYVEQEGEGWV